MLMTACAAEPHKESTLVFSEYRNYNRMKLTTERGWDQYLPEAPTAQFPVPLIVAGAADVAVAVGQEEQPSAAGFFDRRSPVAEADPVRPVFPTV